MCALLPRAGLTDAEDRYRCGVVSGALPTLLALLEVHGTDGVVVERTLLLLRRIAWAAEDKVSLLRTVPALVRAGTLYLVGTLIVGYESHSHKWGKVCAGGDGSGGGGWRGGERSCFRK